MGNSLLKTVGLLTVKLTRSHGSFVVPAPGDMTLWSIPGTAHALLPT